MTPTDEMKPGEWRCQACGTTADEPCRSNGCPDNGSDEEDEGLRARVEALTGERQMLADALRDCMADLAVAQDDAAAARRFLADERAAVAALSDPTGETHPEGGADPRVVVVTRAQVRAAQLRVRSDVKRGITPDPRMIKIANAARGRS